ncbi:MAG: slipin family protein [Elusimicrobia bacterium]|nr:slipin family protein [Elusimicrobiota bacterium]MBD3411876.1 slipin family protein [Elusimicrobiota bacterium]
MSLISVVIIVGIYLLSCIKIVREYERAVIFRLGKVLDKPKGPGIFFVFYPIDQMEKISLRVVALDVPPQDIITKDNVSVQVNAVVYFRVLDPVKSIIQVQNYQYATSQMSQTTLRSVIGQMDLDELLAEREKINSQLQEILDRATDPWGIKVSNVEVKHVDITEELKRVMARQAEAEREKRAKIIAAEGEFIASEKLVEAAKRIEQHPIALQMRYLQTLVEIAAENNSTTVFPIPIDMLSQFFDLQSAKKKNIEKA